MSTLALSPDVIQFLIYGGIAAGGYLVRHLNVFGHSSAAAPASPAPADAGASSSNPILDKLLPVLEDELTQVLQAAAKRLVQTPKT